MLSLPFTMAISSAGGTMDQRFMPIRTGFIQGVSKAIGPRQFAVSISSLPTTHSPLCSPGTVYYSMFAHNAPSPLLCRATKIFLAIVSSVPSLISNGNYNLSHTFQFHCSPGLAHVRHIFSNRLCLSGSAVPWCLEHSGHPSILSE